MFEKSNSTGVICFPPRSSRSNEMTYILFSQYTHIFIYITFIIHYISIDVNILWLDVADDGRLHVMFIDRKKTFFLGKSQNIFFDNSIKILFPLHSKMRTNLQ